MKRWPRVLQFQLGVNTNLKIDIFLDDEAAHIYGVDSKRRKIENQKIGDFIVNAKQSIHFRLSSDINKLEDENATSPFFGPVFVH